MEFQQEQFEIFLKVLLNATAKIPKEYFLLPVASEPEAFEKESIYRERTYCYELYHQMKLKFPDDFLFTLSGEIDKIKHPIIVPECGRIIPDFLVHRPGKMEIDDNLVIIEVKSIVGAKKMSEDDGILKDFKTINCMTNLKKGYYKGIILIYGYEEDMKTQNNIEKIYQEKCHVEKVLLIFHSKPLQEAIIFKTNK